MTRILLTGASGNVGRAILESLRDAHGMTVFRASHGSLAANELFFDFNDLRRSAESLTDIDVLFLLRPPQLADTKKYFAPLIDTCQSKKIKHIVFLSVQGADAHAVIPHAKIEKLIVRSGIDHTFIRPSYFMQNLTTTLKDDIREHSRIVLPAGGASFLWVDVLDVGKAIAAVLRDVTAHRGRIYTITGSELLDFATVAAMLSRVLGRTIHYSSPDPLRFYLHKRRAGLSAAFIFVMLMLHVMPRFERAPPVTADLRHLTGDEPNTLAAFIETHRALWG